VAGWRRTRQGDAHGSELHCEQHVKPGLHTSLLGSHAYSPVSTAPSRPAPAASGVPPSDRSGQVNVLLVTWNSWAQLVLLNGVPGVQPTP
jgi:hypothetical protein